MEEEDLEAREHQRRQPPLDVSACQECPLTPSIDGNLRLEKRLGKSHHRNFLSSPASLKERHLE